jgi:hypothetical protein
LLICLAAESTTVTISWISPVQSASSMVDELAASLSAEGNPSAALSGGEVWASEFRY